MALYKRAEFEKLCGITTSNFKTYLDRGKIVMDSNGMVDDTVEQNRFFLQKRRERLENSVEIKEKQAETPAKKPVKKAKSEPTSDDPESYSKKSDMYILETDQKKLQIQKTTEEIELLRIRREKLNGQLIPTDLVKPLFTQLSKSITSSFHEGADAILVIIAKKKGLSREESASFRKDLIGIVNESVRRATKEVSESVKHIVEEYSNKREAGEKL